jgi:Reverse transcriptase (RNA-dependent DNA polymerase)
MNRYNLRVGYFNCQGCNSTKFDTLHNQVGTLYDILVIAETWNCDEGYRSLLPEYLISSIPRPQSRTHNSGGLMVLVDESISPLISEVHKSYHSVSFKINRDWFTAVYLPPSMTPSEFYDELCSTCSIGTTILLGDFNVRMGKSVGIHPVNHREKFEKLNSICGKHDLIIHRPVECNAVNDHLFTSPDIHTEYHYTAHESITSDHLVMNLTFFDYFNHRQPHLTIPKFCLGTLKNEGTSLLLKQSYNENGLPQSFFSHLLTANTQHDLVQLDLEERQSLIDSCNQLLTTTLTEIAKATVGTHRSGKPKVSVNPPTINHSNQPSAGIAIQAFKNSQKNIRSFICSSRRDLSPTEDAVRHFTELYTSPDGAVIDSSPSLPTSPPPLDMLAAFRTSFVKKLIRKYPAHKSGGPDGIHIKLLKPLVNSNLSLHLSNLFSLCIILGITPSQWNLSLVAPIPKKNTSKFISDMRPISLTNMFRRLFESLLLQYYRTSEQPFLSLHPLQGGFIPRLNTLFHPIMAHETALRKYSIHLYYDFKNAYDKVNISLMLRKLRDKGGNPLILSLTHSLFTNQCSHITVNGVISQVFPRQCGLFQGSILAPMLFNIFIDDLAYKFDERFELLSTWNPFPGIQLFADDVKCATNNINEAQEMTNTITAWAKENEMTLNRLKCGIVGLPPNTQILLDGEPIPVMDSYMYLGFPMTKTGIDFTSFIKNKVDLAAKSLSLLQAVGGKWDEFTKLLVFKIFVRSRLEYGLPILWSFLHNLNKKMQKLTWHPIEKLQSDFSNWIFPSKAPVRMTTINNSILGLPTMFTRAEVAAVGLSWKLYTCDQDLPITTMIHYGLTFNARAEEKNLLVLENIVQMPRLPHLLSTLADPNSNITTLRGYGRQLFRSSYHTSKLKLPLCILPKARHLGWSYDCLLRIPDSRYRSFAIKWRRNTWIFGPQSRRVCLLHNDLFTRRCVNDCFLLSSWEPGADELASLESSFQIHISSNNVPENYNVIDHLLNLQLYHLLPSLVEHLDTIVPLVPEMEVDDYIVDVT